MPSRATCNFWWRWLDDVDILNVVEREFKDWIGKIVCPGAGETLERAMGNGNLIYTVSVTMTNHWS